MINWRIAAIGLLGLIALSDLLLHSPEPPPTFCNWATFASLHVAVGPAHLQ
jgi:hypothetical protein